MIYFVNEYVMALNSGVEHAEFKRLAIFKHAKTSAKILTRDYNYSLHRMAAGFDLDQDDLLNMYDFFQDATMVSPKKTSTKTLHLPFQYQVSPDANVSRVMQGGRLVMKIHHTPGRVGELGFTEFFDTYGNITNRVFYDDRGFKSGEAFLNQAGQVFAEVLYKPNGQRALERFYEVTEDGKGTVLFNIRVVNYQGRDYYFNSEDELFTFLLDEVNRKDGLNDVFIADRPSIANSPLIKMTTPAKKYIWFPIAHATDPFDQVESPLDGNYVEVLSNHLNRIDGLITMTQAQARDLRTRLHSNSIQIHVIPGAAVSDAQLAAGQLPAVNKKENKIIYVGRLEANKRVDDLIRAFKLVLRKVPDAKLDIRGYGSSEFVASLEKLIKELKLTDQAVINGYTPKIEAVYDQAKVFATATSSDAYPLAMTEALSHGLPLVAFDINYGPSEIIQNGKNGYLLKNGDVYGFSEALVKLLQDPAELQDMSSEAYASAQAYSLSKMWQLWQPLVETEKATVGVKMS
ncbi:accessory Sec system glycosyltransferase Asp1 [Lacticaseibacillus paracasei]|uniref:accessory Sec system glycosyltransferase Asp1 n=1 Tax=Lacticaseibacillus paracasei TaxID=1597 RepID=UPI0021C42012|nr:accessory Sec system glycosyltransferase Asp1 [Lacticaseibacillus paracasei]MCP9310372.1 accessory Sec system glycosyltransferase Asp1 [Lacticaseibacillus paracasei]MCP9347703.1 accessory Sec system glycosyltransferase Asp1 [Lacticaseibacillus paracasei]MCP9367327.1 accessory Sec system glycosyltransferase Asp1 [Lacticaseibacillus paracasei]MCP9378585.1 accessory Sec system glycosyltransferase Asp1 [Lacticaseibacillus paracasei]